MTVELELFGEITTSETNEQTNLAMDGEIPN